MSKIDRCIECSNYLDGKENQNLKWCSMDCKEKTFINCFENSQWTYKLINTKLDFLLKKVEACLIFPWEGCLAEGNIDKTREWLIDKQRTAFNKIVRDGLPEKENHLESKRKYYKNILLRWRDDCYKKMIVLDSELCLNNTEFNNLFEDLINKFRKKVVKGGETKR